MMVRVSFCFLWTVSFKLRGLVVVSVRGLVCYEIAS